MKKFTLMGIAGILLLMNSCGDKEKVKPSCQTFNITTQTEPASCGGSDGKITVAVTGVEGNLQYSIDGTNFQSETQFTGLMANAYVVTVKDENNCSSTKEVVLNEANDITLSTTTAIAGCGGSDGKIMITTSGGAGGYTYKVDNSAFQSDATFSGLAAKDYLVTVKDANGCSKAATVHVPSGISFANVIKPIVDGSCAIAGCHVSGGQSPNFTVFSNIQSNASKIKTRTGNKTMPKTGSLTDLQIQQIACWVDDGALNN
jgi:hypothetical protein